MWLNLWTHSSYPPPSLDFWGGLQCYTPPQIAVFSCDFWLCCCRTKASSLLWCRLLLPYPSSESRPSLPGFFSWREEVADSVELSAHCGERGTEWGQLPSAGGCHPCSLVVSLASLTLTHQKAWPACQGPMCLCHHSCSRVNKRIGL